MCSMGGRTVTPSAMSLSMLICDSAWEVSLWLVGCCDTPLISDGML